MKSIIPSNSKVDTDIVEGVIVSQFHLKALYIVLKVLDFILVAAFFAVSRSLLQESINPMLGLAVLLVRLLWHKFDAKVRMDLGIEEIKKSRR